MDVWFSSQTHASLFILWLLSIHLPFFLSRKYIAIVSYEQRQNYKDDFNAEYDEYRALHARMETVARRFIKLDAQRKRLSPGSKEYQVSGCTPRWTGCSRIPSSLPYPANPANPLLSKSRAPMDSLISLPSGS